MTMATLDNSLSIEQAAAALAVSAERLMRWMDNNEWLIIQDQSFDVVWDQVNVTGNLVAKNGGVRVTSKGMAALRLSFPAAAASPLGEGEIPF